MRSPGGLIGVHLSEFCGDFCEILMDLVTAWCGMVRGIMAGGLKWAGGWTHFVGRREVVSW